MCFKYITLFPKTMSRTDDPTSGDVITGEHLTLDNIVNQKGVIVIDSEGAVYLATPIDVNKEYEGKSIDVWWKAQFPKGEYDDQQDHSYQPVMLQKLSMNAIEFKASMEKKILGTLNAKPDLRVGNSYELSEILSAGSEYLNSKNIFRKRSDYIVIELSSPHTGPISRLPKLFHSWFYHCEAKDEPVVHENIGTYAVMNLTVADVGLYSVKK